MQMRWMSALMVLLALAYGADAAPPQVDDGGWTTLCADEDWYKRQPAVERVFRGRLEILPPRGEATTLMRSALYKLAERMLFTRARRLPALDALAGAEVEIRGKAVDIDLEGQHLGELWPGAIRPAPNQGPAATPATLELVPGVTDRGAVPARWELDLRAADMATAQALAAGVSSRLYGTGEKGLTTPLTIEVRRDLPGLFAGLVQAASLGGAVLEIDVDGRLAGRCEWPAAAQTHRVNRIFWTPLAAGEHTIRLRATAGVVVMPRYWLAAAAADLPSDLPRTRFLVEPARTQVGGYRGIWFTLGQFYGKGDGDRPYKASKTPVFPYGDKYSGGLGTYTSSHCPVAVYAPAVKKTFFVYGGTTAADQRHLLCMASYYDHASGRVPQPTVVHDKVGVNDPHDNPSLALDDQGYLWVFVSGRGRVRPGFKYRSVKAYSTEAFERVSEEEMTYPQPHWLAGKGFLHVFTKYTGVRELYWETSSDGVTWSDDQKLAGIREPGHSRGGHYQVSCQRDGRVGSFFNRHPDGNVDRRTDLYYVETADQGQTWTTVAGLPLATPLTEVGCAARIQDYARLGRNVYVCDADFDAAGRPVVLYVTSRGAEPGPPNDPREWCVCRWTGEAWETAVVTAADHNYDMGSLYLSPDVWRVIAPTDPGPQPYHAGGEMVLWESSDQGRTWRRVMALTAGSETNHTYARRPLGAAAPFLVFWADGDPTRLTPSRLYLSDGEGGHVWRLPYEMAGPEASLELVLRPAAP